MTDTGQRVGDYEVLAPLGAGGMGRVFKVRNVISNREEAMKILLPDFAADPDLAARFMAEIRTLAGLEHPGIAQLRTAFQHQNQFVMVMEFVEGTTLEKLAAQTRIPQGHVLDYATQVLAALSYAHSRGVTHRDIKPANIMVTTHGLIKLMDFGIAKSTDDMQLTRPGTTMGSVYYMSPEQVRGGTVDARSDLYSFGVTLYEMLAGRKPFEADTSYSVLNAQLNQAPTPLLEIDPAIPPELNNIVLRALAKLPEQRFQTADEFCDAIRRLRDLQRPVSTGTIYESAIPRSPGYGAPGMQPAGPQPSGQQARPSTGTTFEAVTPAPGYAVPGAQHAGAQGRAPSTGTTFEAIPTPPSAYGAGGPQQTAAPQPPPFTPVAMPPVPASRAQKPRRGLWIGLGAVTAILALIAVAALLPRIFSTHANPKQASDTNAAVSAPALTTPPPAPQLKPDASPAPQATVSAAGVGATQKPGSVSAAPGRPAGQISAPVAANPPRAPYVSPSRSTGSGSTEAAAPVASEPASSAAGSSARGASGKEMREARDRYSNIESRADAALAGVEQIRSQQQAQGMDIRGDILASMNRLHHQLDDARRSLDQNDLEAANEYLSHAETETSRLEKFLGR